MNKEKDRFAYRTSSERIKYLKQYALLYDMNVNQILDQLVDEFISKKKGVKK